MFSRKMKTKLPPSSTLHNDIENPTQTSSKPSKPKDTHCDDPNCKQTHLSNIHPSPAMKKLILFFVVVFVIMPCFGFMWYGSFLFQIAASSVASASASSFASVDTHTHQKNHVNQAKVAVKPLHPPPPPPPPPPSPQKPPTVLSPQQQLKPKSQSPQSPPTTNLKPAHTTSHSLSPKSSIFLLSDTYPLKKYLILIESLLFVNFTGDVVLGVSYTVSDVIVDYLLGVSNDVKNGMNVVIYRVPWLCKKKPGVGKGDENGWLKEGDTNGGVSDCVINMNGDAGKENSVGMKARPIATARYELYHLWWSAYREKGNANIMLLDFRDAFFQVNPFNTLPPKDTKEYIYLYAENETIAKSSYNSRWLTTAYSLEVMSGMSDLNVICSGTTLGSHGSIGVYLELMNLQFEETKCVLKGCDQGFHNFLIHSKLLEKKLKEGKVESLVKIWEQGGVGSMVNNLATLRKTPLLDQGVLVQKKANEGGDKMFLSDGWVVVNYNGEASAVVHQYDRDKGLKSIVGKKENDLETAFNQMKKKRGV